MAASNNAAQTARRAADGPRRRRSTIIAVDRDPIEVKRIMSGNQLGARSFSEDRFAPRIKSATAGFGIMFETPVRVVAEQP